MSRDTRFHLVILVAIGLWLPLARLDWFSSHEMASYVVRTVEWAGELRAGALYPRWCPDFYGGYGAPFFVFHGPVVYGIAGLLHATVLDPFWSLKIVALLASLLAGVGAYALVLGETRDRDAALLGAIAYLAAPYRLGNLYDRGDLAEFTCLALLPLVIVLYRAAAREALPGRAQRLAVAAAVTHAMMIATHPVLGFWGTIVTGLIVLVSVGHFLARGAFRRALWLVGAMASALGLASIYLVPALAYRSLTNIALMTTGPYNPQDNWISFGTLFASRTPELARNFMNIGPLLVLAGTATALGLARSPRRARSALAWLGFAALLVFLVLPQAAAFWAPHRVPLVSFIQFPWRLLGPVALLASVATGIGAAAACEGLAESLRSRIAGAGAAVLVFAVAWPHASAKGMATESVPLHAESIRQQMLSTTAADEFIPRGAVVPSGKPVEHLVTATDGVAVEHTSSHGSHHLLTLRAERAGANLGLALHGFPGWTVSTVEGPAESKPQLQTDSQGLLRLGLPAVGLYRLRLWYGGSVATTVGGILSGLSALALGFTLLLGFRPWPWRLPIKASSGGAA